jgi:hypothetical protein
MMSGVPLETCWACNERWNNKFYYMDASCWLFFLSYLSNVRQIITHYFITNYNHHINVWKQHLVAKCVLLPQYRFFCLPKHLKIWLTTTEVLLLLFSRNRGVTLTPPTTSSADVKERVELYLYSPYGTLWYNLGWTSPFTFSRKG